MEDTIMEVNLCPSSNFGRASCSVYTDGSEDVFFSKIENQAVVRLEHTVTAICPVNGEIQYTTIIPDKNIDYNGKIIYGELTPTTGHDVNKFEFRARGIASPTAQKSLLQSHTASYRPVVWDINKKSSNLLPGGNDVSKSRKVPEDQPSRGTKRKNPDELDLEIRDEKRTRRNKQWSQANMHEAIEAVRNGMRVRRAAKMFSVPRTTLKYKLNGRSSLNKDMAQNNLGEKITEVTKELKEVKKKSLPHQEEQMKGNISIGTGPKNPVTKEHSTKPCERNHIKPSSHQVPVHNMRSLRSNSNILQKEVVIPLQKVTENSKEPVLVNPPRNKSVKVQTTNIPNSKQKTNSTNQSSMPKNSKTSKEQYVRKNEKEELKCEEKKIFKLWSEESMKDAMQAVEEGCKIREAAIKYGIPRSTLGRRLSTAAFNRISNSLFKSDPQPNASGIEFVVRQSPRRQKTALVPNTSQKASGLQPPEEREERKNVEKEVRVEDKSAANTKNGHTKVNWSEESMGNALEAVEQGMSLCSAAKKFNVPPASLKTRKYKRGSRNVGPEPHISAENEDQIVNYVNDCATIGFINVKQVGLLLVAEAAEKKLIWDIKKQGLPSDEWWDAFCSRRESHFKNVDMMQPRKRIRLTEARLSLFYDKLSALKNSSQYHQALINCSDCRTFTVQEFKYDLDNVTQWVGDSHGENGSPHRRTEVDPQNKLVSSICCASAAGNSIPPMFVYHTENNYKIPASGLVGPFGAVHFVHDMNDLTRNSDFYLKWFQDVFLKYAPQSRPLIMLFDPDTAFITPELIQLAQKNDIMLLGLPPASAHVTQPLNRTVFPALKKGFTFTSSLFKRIFVKGVNFNNFARCFKVAWNSSVDAAVIKMGFAETGIHPVDRKILFKTKP